MRLVWHMFRKDAARLRWIWLASLAPLALFTWFDCGKGFALPRNMNYDLSQMTQMLLPMAWWFLAAAIVQSEAIPGDRQYWLTRPIPRGALLASKLAVAGAAASLPLFVAWCVIVAVNGHSLGEYVGALMADQVRVFLAIMLPAMALAAVTETMARFIAATFLVVLVEFMQTVLTGVLRPWSLESLERITVPAAFTTCAIAAVSILLLQYRHRATNWARAVLVAAALAVPAWRLLPVNAAFAAQAGGSNGEGAGRLRIVLDSARGATASPGGARSYGGSVRMAIPVRIEGAGADPEVRFEWTGREIEAGGAVDRTDLPYGADIVDRRDGARLWLSAPRAFVDRAGDAPARVRLWGAAAVMGQVSRSLQPGLFSYRLVDGIGFCSSETDAAEFVVNIYCNAPVRGPEWTSVRMVDRTTNEPLTSEIRLPRRGQHSPQGSRWRVSPLDRTQASYILDRKDGIERDRLANASLEFTNWTRQSFGRVEIELSGIRLKDWLVGDALAVP